ncbi:MAG: Gfo/Idh/MocA family oxidoreductase [Rhodobacteraceae bacterium]|nr:Gfo/Idh/MocA family oxidoreductase [Paracoccaceae bacterium]
MSTRILLLGAGLMAAKHAERFAEIPGATVVGVVDTREDVGAEFAKTHGIEREFTSLGDALDWGQFDAAANVTPDPVHYPTTMELLAAKKHVLCEKPLATTFAHADEMASTAEAAGLINMVNLSYREVAAMREAARMVAAGDIGDVRYFEASYLQSWLTQDAWGDWASEPAWLWRLSTAHGSKGVLGDVGIHILDFATHVAGADVDTVACQLKTFEKAPAPGNEAYAPLDANDSAIMTVALANGATGTVNATRYASGHLNDLYLRIFGTKGGLEVSFAKNTSALRYCATSAMTTATWEDVPALDVPTNQAVFVKALTEGGEAMPDFRRGAALQAVLDAAEASDLDDGRRITLG